MLKEFFTHAFLKTQTLEFLKNKGDFHSLPQKHKKPFRSHIQKIQDEKFKDQKYKLKKQAHGPPDFYGNTQKIEDMILSDGHHMIPCKFSKQCILEYNDKYPSSHPIESLNHNLVFINDYELILENKLQDPQNITQKRELLRMLKQKDEFMNEAYYNQKCWTSTALSVQMIIKSIKVISFDELLLPSKQLIAQDQQVITHLQYNLHHIFKDIMVNIIASQSEARQTSQSNKEIAQNYSVFQELQVQMVQATKNMLLSGIKKQRAYEICQKLHQFENQQNKQRDQESLQQTQKQNLNQNQSLIKEKNNNKNPAKKKRLDKLKSKLIGFEGFKENQINFLQENLVETSDMNQLNLEEKQKEEKIGDWFKTSTQQKNIEIMNSQMNESIDMEELGDAIDGMSLFLQSQVSKNTPKRISISKEEVVVQNNTNQLNEDDNQDVYQIGAFQNEQIYQDVLKKSSINSCLNEESNNPQPNQQNIDDEQMKNNECYKFNIQQNQDNFISGDEVDEDDQFQIDLEQQQNQMNKKDQVSQMKIQQKEESENNQVEKIENQNKWSIDNSNKQKSQKSNENHNILSQALLNDASLQKIKENEKEKMKLIKKISQKKESRKVVDYIGMGVNEKENQKKLKEFKQQQKQQEQNLVIKPIFTQDDEDSGKKIQNPKQNKEKIVQGQGRQNTNQNNYSISDISETFQQNNQLYQSNSQNQNLELGTQIDKSQGAIQIQAVHSQISKVQINDKIDKDKTHKLKSQISNKITENSQISIIKGSQQLKNENKDQKNMITESSQKFVNNDQSQQKSQAQGQASQTKLSQLFSKNSSVDKTSSKKQSQQSFTGQKRKTPQIQHNEQANKQEKISKDIKKNSEPKNKVEAKANEKLNAKKQTIKKKEEQNNGDKKQKTKQQTLLGMFQKTKQ